MKKGRVKKAVIAGGSNAHENANANKKYKTNGDVQEGFKKKKTRFADDKNFTEDDLGTNNTKEQFAQFVLNLVGEYGRDGNSCPERWADSQLAHLEQQLSVDARKFKEGKEGENEEEYRFAEEECVHMLTLHITAANGSAGTSASGPGRDCLFLDACAPL
eukprot:15337875-Ditylum_brightwellii.AAC.1